MKPCARREALGCPLSLRPRLAHRSESLARVAADVDGVLVEQSRHPAGMSELIPRRKTHHWFHHSGSC